MKSPLNSQAKQDNHARPVHSQSHQGVADLRPQALQMKQMQEMAQTSSQTSDMARLQHLADNGPKAMQLKALQALGPSPTSGTESVQRKDAAPANNTGLPDTLKNGVEKLSGHSMNDVQVHYNSAKPAQLNALAYAQGSDIHIGPGQEQHLPHEAWHVAQQKQGRVSATKQLKGQVNINDDAGLEREADIMGAKAASYSGPQEAQASLSQSGASSSGPVQRLIGFEVEAQVPVYGPALSAVTLNKGKDDGSKNINHFLYGGLPYDTASGGSDKKGDNSFKLTTDHRRILSTEPIRAKLAALGKLNPADTRSADPHSNLEYVTSPMNELAEGADKTIGDVVKKMATHASSTYTKASADTASKIDAPATKLATGIPVDDLKSWLSNEDYDQIDPLINNLKGNIEDSLYIQATVGIIPGGFFELFNKAADESSVHRTDGNFGDIISAANTIFEGVSSSLAPTPYIKKLKKQKETEAIFAISGIIKLLSMYLVGEVISRTSAFPGGTIKNAVPFLVKIDPKKIAGAGPLGMLFKTVPDEFIKSLSDALKGREELTLDYWIDKGYTPRNRGDDNTVTSHSITKLAKLFLQGKDPLDETFVQTGGISITKPDNMKEISGLFSQNEGQKGIPLEYRYVKARPKAANLKAEIMKIVEDARDINLSRCSPEEKSEVEEQVKK